MNKCDKENVVRILRILFFLFLMTDLSPVSAQGSSSVGGLSIIGVVAQPSPPIFASFHETTVSVSVTDEGQSGSVLLSVNVSGITFEYLCEEAPRCEAFLYSGLAMWPDWTNIEPTGYQTLCFSLDQPCIGDGLSRTVNFSQFVAPSIGCGEFNIGYDMVMWAFVADYHISDWNNINLVNLVSAYQVIRINVHYSVSCVPPDPISLYISHIEVTQAIQDSANNVPLIAGKPTLVRVYLDCLEPYCPIANVTGQLTSSGRDPIPPENVSITVNDADNWEDLRPNLDQTLNFTLPADWWLNPGDLTFTAEVDGQTMEFSRPLNETRPLNVIYVPIRYQGREPVAQRIRDAANWAAQIFPTFNVQYVPGATLDWSSCLELAPNICPNRRKHRGDLVNELTRLYRAYNVKVFGWLPDNIYGGGTSDPSWPPVNGAGVAAFSDEMTTFPLHSGRLVTENGASTFAHEIAHLLGRRHTNTPGNSTNGNCYGGAPVDPGSDWVNHDNSPAPPPFPDSKIQDFGINGLSYGWAHALPFALYHPDSSYDYMSYCGLLADDNIWTSPFTYYRLYYDYFQLSPSPFSAQVAMPYLMVSGLVYTDDTVMLDPIGHINPDFTPPNPSPGTAYCVEAQGDSGNVISSYCFDLSFMNYETMEATNVDFFNVVLPELPGITRVVLKKQGQEIASRSISNNPPQITLLTPNGGENWGADETQTITWTASDTDGDTLTYDVFYSADGTEWMPLGNLIAEMQFNIYTADLEGSSAGRIRVVANDGFRESNDESDATFTVAKKTPQVSIFSPQNGQVFLPDATIFLQGSAYDREDGALTGASLNWSSNIAGSLGSGETISISLGEGDHIISLTATDIDGNQSAATVAINVELPSDSPNTVPSRNHFLTYKPTLTWGGVSWAVGYEIQVDDDRQFRSPEYANNMLSADTISIMTNPLARGTYFWRIRAKHADGNWRDWSAVDTFVIGAP